MAKSQTIQVRVKPEVKKEAEELLSQLGVSMSEAVNMFLHQVVLRQGLPFDVRLSKNGSSDLPSEGNAKCQASSDPALGFEGRGRILPLSEIRRNVARVASDYPAIERVVLFGSYARGEAHEESDVDLRMHYDPNVKFSLFDLSGFICEIESSLGKKVDVVSVHDLRDESFERNIKRDGVVIYEREK